MGDNTKTLRFTLERLPKGSGGVRFHEVTPSGEDPVIGVIYVRQEYLRKFGKVTDLNITIGPAAAA